MLVRGALGLCPDHLPRRSSHLRDQLPGKKKPCHSVRGSTFLPARSARSLAAASRQAKKTDPLFLFHCGMQWQQKSDTASGWELVQAMRSTDRGSRALAAEFLATTENGRLLVRDLRRTRSGLEEIKKQPQNAAAAQGDLMNTPYGLQMVENCLSCHLRKQGWYCALSPDLLKTFSGFSHLTTYPGGAILFVEGQKSRGGFVICSGRVKLFTTSREGKILVMKIADPGEIIGLSATISGDAYGVTAETVGPCLINFVERDGLVRLMERSGELGLRSALAISREFQTAYRDIQDLVLARSSSGKLARLLLSWVSQDKQSHDKLSHDRPSIDRLSQEKQSSQPMRIQAPVTHEEMAQRIGASRETVTRLLSELRRKDFITLEGSTLIIKNRPALEAMAV